MNNACLVHSVLMHFFSFFRLGFDRVEKKGSKKISLHYNRYSAKVIAIILILIFSLFSTAVLQYGYILILALVFIPLILAALLLIMVTISIDLDFSNKKIVTNLLFAGNIMSTCSIGLVHKKDLQFFKVRKIVRKPFETQKRFLHKMIINRNGRNVISLISGEPCLAVLIKFIQESSKS